MDWLAFFILTFKQFLNKKGIIEIINVMLYFFNGHIVREMFLKSINKKLNRSQVVRVFSS